MNYFNELQQRIREIRLSEKFFYQKIKDIYTTSIDYNPKDEKTIDFFKIVQNKLLWAIPKLTAAVCFISCPERSRRANFISNNENGFYRLLAKKIIKLNVTLFLSQIFTIYATNSRRNNNSTL